MGLPQDVRGVARVDDRRVLNGIFYKLRTGIPWGKKHIRNSRRALENDTHKGIIIECIKGIYQLSQTKYTIPYSKIRGYRSREHPNYEDITKFEGGVREFKADVKALRPRHKEVETAR